MVGTLRQVLDDMEKGVTNFCIDGRCSECGQCCSALLPVSSKEIKNIKRYIKKNHIKPVVHNVLLNVQVDWTCPFLDESKGNHKCVVYPVRPKICEVFQCNQPPSQIKENKDFLRATRIPVNMWKVKWWENEKHVRT